MPAWMRHLPQGVKGKGSQTQEERGPSLECPQGAGLAQEARFSTSSLALGPTWSNPTLPDSPQQIGSVLSPSFLSHPACFPGLIYTDH